jgi:Putative binding domain, N-terminal
MEIIYKEKSYAKKLSVFLLIAFLSASLFYISSFLADFETGGGPTATTSPPGDKDDSLVVCVGKTSQTNAIGHLALSNTFWNAQVVYGSSWLTLSGSTGFQGNGVLNYNITPNTQPDSRFGIIVIAGKQFILEQTGTNVSSSCPATITPNYASSLKAGGVFRLYVNSESNQMNWDAVVSADDKSWIHTEIDPAMQYVDVEILPNASTDRITFITIDTVKVPIIQKGNTPKL